MKKHIIFDLDGTLINTFPIMREAWRIVSKKFDLKIPFYEYKKFTGLPFDKIMDKLGLSNSRKEIKKLYFNETKKRSKKIKLIRGAKELINFLNKKGYLISIITSKPRENFNAIKSIIPNCIKLVICSDDTSYSKPDKNLIKFLLVKLPNKNSNLVYIGDTIFDMQFAINSGIDFIFFSDNEKNKMPKNIINKFNSVEKLLEIKNLI